MTDGHGDAHGAGGRETGGAGRETTAVTGAPVERRHGGRIPATVVSGFLGAGKTTLVNRILAAEAGLRVAVVVNEFGAVGIDGALVAAAAEDVIELPGGCLCCTLGDDLAAALRRLGDRLDRIDHLVVETTGLADPLPVATTLMRPEHAAVFRLDGIVTLVDAENFDPSLCVDPAARNQLRHADVLVLNKADRADAARLAAVEAALRGLGAAAPVLAAVAAAVPLPLLLGVDRGECASPDGADRWTAEETTGHGAGYSSLAFEADRAFDVEALQRFLEAAPGRGVYRGKGVLRLAGHDAPLVFHLVGRRFSIEPTRADARDAGPGEADAPTVPRNRLVLIGRGLDHAALERDLAGCLER